MKLSGQITKEQILGAVARGWCHTETEQRTMDAELASAIADEVWHAISWPDDTRPPLDTPDDLSWPIRLRLRLLVNRPSRWNAWVRDFTAWLGRVA